MTGTSKTYEVRLVLGFAVSEAKARQVLERWWKFKEKRKAYMRDRRAGRVKKVVA